MEKKLLRLVFAVLFLCYGGLVQATNIDFNSVNPLGTIQTGDSYDRVTLHDSAIVTMTGGTAYYVGASDSSTFYMQGGNISAWLFSGKTSTVTISGGSVKTLHVYNSSVTNISGGNVFDIWDTDTPIVNIYGKNFYSTFHLGEGWLITGNWNDAINSSFSIWYRADSSVPPPGSLGSHIVLHTIPEPATLFLFGLSAILLREKLSK
jgi:hypothetical protein